MIERGIPFSPPLVCRVLDGSKTQTRRLIGEDWWRCLDPEDEDDRAKALTMAPYRVGFRLWVREHWRAPVELDDLSPSAIGARSVEVGYRLPWCPIEYVADGQRYNWARDTWGDPGRFRQARHMPRWASRLTLEVTAVRVERLHDITEPDAKAEGVEPWPVAEQALSCEFPPRWARDEPHRVGFGVLWDKINGDRSPWSENPWVWVYEFKRLEDR